MTFLDLEFWFSTLCIIFSVLSLSLYFIFNSIIFIYFEYLFVTLLLLYPLARYFLK